MIHLHLFFNYELILTQKIKKKYLLLYAVFGKGNIFLESSNETTGNSPKKTKTRAPARMTAPTLTFATAPFAKSKLFFTGTVINGTLNANST